MEPIIYNEWETLGVKWETGDRLPKERIMFVTCDHIAALFRTHSHQIQDKIIISAASDYGVSPQSKYPPEEDFRRWFPMQPLKGIGYRDLYLPARLDQGKCLKDDLYAIRSYSWMHSTFNYIPEHLAWFCTNSEISSNHHIPFGLDRESWALIQKYKDLPKKDRVFCAWSNNTNERHSLKLKLRGVGGFVQFEELDKEMFIYELCSSKYSLCPEGNGKDSYRVLESLYGGVIPLLCNNSWSPYGNLTGLIDYNTLNISMSEQTNWELIDFNYWKQQIVVK